MEYLSTRAKWLVSLDIGPMGAAWRIVVGFATVPMVARTIARPVSGWTAVLSFVSVLVLIRVFLFAFRSILPFPRAIQEIWAKRRQFAKRHDCYQWRKMLWIGAGLGLFLAISNSRPISWMVMCCFAIASGILGMIRWRAVGSKFSIR